MTLKSHLFPNGESLAQGSDSMIGAFNIPRCTLPLRIPLTLIMVGFISACANNNSPERVSVLPTQIEPPITGGPCVFAERNGSFEITQIEHLQSQVRVHYKFLPDQGIPAIPQDKLLSELVGSWEPALNQTFRGVRREETKGACPPLWYTFTNDGKSHTFDN